MREIAIAYVAAAIVMAGLDFVWLKLTVDGLYHGALGNLMAAKPNMVGAAAFYVVYLVGVVVLRFGRGSKRGNGRRP